MALLNDSLGGTKCWENGGRVADDISEWLMMILQVSKTLVICICSISIIKCVAHFLLKGTEKLCALPQRNCHFLIPVFLQKFTAFIFRCLWRLFHHTRVGKRRTLNSWTCGFGTSNRLWTYYRLSMVVRFQYHIALEFAFPGCLSWVPRCFGDSYLHTPGASRSWSLKDMLCVDKLSLKKPDVQWRWFGTSWQAILSHRRIHRPDSATLQRLNNGPSTTYWNFFSWI